MMKKRYFAIPILAIALHFLLSNLLYFLVERLVLDVFHIPSQQFMKHSYWGEILIYAVLILVFFTLYSDLLESSAKCCAWAQHRHDVDFILSEYLLSVKGGRCRFRSQCCPR